MTIYKENDIYVDDAGNPVRTYQRSFGYRDLSDGKTKSVDDLMLEVESHQFVNETSATRIGFVDGPFKEYLASNDNLPTEDDEYHPRMKGDHQYRTGTRFVRNDNGTYSMVMALPEKDDDEVKIIRDPADRAAGREKARKRAIVEKRAITRMRNKIDKQQSIGNPDCVQSRDEDFPLLAVLRRDKRADLIAAVLQYRQLVALCESEPLKGQSYGAGDGGTVDHYSSLEDGEIVYSAKVRRSQGAYNLPAVRVNAAVINEKGDQSPVRTESLHIKLNEDTLADYIDSKPILARIRSALGPLLEPVEDAVLGGQTLAKVGADHGATGREATSSGKALVYRGLSVLDGFFAYKNITNGSCPGTWCRWRR